MLKLLVAVDGSALSLKPIESLGQWTRRGVPLKIVLVNVLGSAPSAGEMPAEHRDAFKAAQRRAQHRLLQEAESRALGCGVSLHGMLALEGPPAQEIVRAATTQGVDLIVMGAHGSDAVGGGSLVPGSVAQRVLCLAGHPVLLVP
jgi:nucleotide-binding universal stress UspA family protein